MPVRGGAVWKLAAGDFDYYQWEIRGLRFAAAGQHSEHP
jgi:hypothetical protein